MKSVHEVMGLYIGLFKDLITQYPSFAAGLERSLNRLLLSAGESGLSTYTIVLPEVSNFLQSCLEQGYIDVVDEERPALCGALSRNDLRPKFLWDLWTKIFDGEGKLLARPDTNAIAAIRQVSLMMKKLRVECEERYVNKAISNFREIESSLPRSWDETWDVDHPVWSRRDGHPIWGSITMDDDQANLLDNSHTMYEPSFDPDWAGFRAFCARFAAQLGYLDPFGIEGGRPSIRPKHGPGAVSDKSSYTKYDGLYWTERLEPLFPYDWFGAPSSEHLDYFQYREFPSQLLAVPKSQKGPRLIAAEPTAHQWIQGGIQRWLEDSLKHTFLRDCIDFRRQDLSRDLALMASVAGELATIDLSSASDRLSTRLVEYCIPNYSVLDALHASRTRVVRLPKGDHLLLRKFATQGSACTFPVETIVFTLLSIWGTYLTMGKPGESPEGFAQYVRVFGDDIIVPKDAYGCVVGLLESCLLSVNTEKSYYRGKFRESCGMDAYAGVDVTPAYVRELYGPAPTSLESIVECSNNLHLKGWWHTASALLQTVPHQERKKLLIRKADDDGTFGLASFCGYSDKHLKHRWNSDLQRREVKVISVDSRPKMKRGLGHGDLLQFFTEEPSQDSPYRGGQVAGLKSRKTLRWVSSSK